MIEAPEREVEETLLLKLDQSVKESLPEAAAEAKGRLKLRVAPEPVMVKSVPFVVEARLTAGPVVVCPVGPMEVRAAFR